MKKLFLILILLACPVHAADQPIVFLSDAELAAHKNTLARVEAYLTGLTTINADFTQTAPDGSVTTGKFYLQRPGKMRWQYYQTPVLIVSDGGELIFYDYELQQVSRIPINSTVIGFLTEKIIHFGGKIGVTAFDDSYHQVRITIAEREKPEDGMLTFEFSDDPLALRNLIVTDAANQKTTVSLANAIYGQPLDPTLFQFTEPKRQRIH